MPRFGQAFEVRFTTYNDWSGVTLEISLSGSYFKQLVNACNDRDIVEVLPVWISFGFSWTHLIPCGAVLSTDTCCDKGNNI